MKFPPDASHVTQPRCSQPAVKINPRRRLLLSACRAAAILSHALPALCQQRALPAQQHTQVLFCPQILLWQTCSADGEGCCSWLLWSGCAGTIDSGIWLSASPAVTVKTHFLILDESPTCSLKGKKYIYQLNEVMDELYYWNQQNDFH